MSTQIVICRPLISMFSWNEIHVATLHNFANVANNK
jgi:hypothetical protein